MLLTTKLLAYLNRVFDKDPKRFLALRLTYAGGMSWRVENGVLTTVAVGGPGVSLTVDLTQYTVTGLVAYLSSQQGYSVLYKDNTELTNLSARVLLDGASDIATSNGDHLYGYTNVLWAYLESAANELLSAKTAVDEMLKQMSTTTAGDVWLDYLGLHYGIPRLVAEADAAYGPRIIAEVLRPRANNVAIENAIKVFTGQDATVTDVVEWTSPLPKYNGANTHNGAINYNSTAQPRYGLFDVAYGYDILNGGDIASFQAVVTSLIGRLRDAGTHLRSLLLTGSTLFDELSSPPTDDTDLGLVVGAPLTDDSTAPDDTALSVDMALAAMDDTASIGSEAATGTYVFTTSYNGLRVYDGAVGHRGGYSFVGANIENEETGVRT